MELINIKDLIQELKNKNIDFGKGDPYNRLRYYTKIGWIDHMIRKKDSSGIVTGHYPLKVVEKIIEIEKFKKMGHSNEEITRMLENKNKEITKKEDSILEKFKKNINLIILIIIILGFTFELKNRNSLNDKLQITPNFNESNTKSIIISDKGKNTMPSGKNKIFINSKSINLKSVILITFEGKIDPATHYFVTEKILEEGFTLETNYPVYKNVNFNWVIIN